MERASAALVLALTLAGPLVAGCLQDLDRRHLDPAWRSGAELVEGPARDERGAPAMLVVSGPVELPSDVNVTLTGVEANLTHGNRTIDLEPMRVHSDEGTQSSTEAEGSLTLDPGETLTVTFVPAADNARRANPDLAWNASIELQWRYRAGEQFDAGRIEVDHNLSPTRVEGLGWGVVQRSEGQVTGLVFSAIDADQLPEEVPLTVTRIGGGQAETIDRLDVTVNRSDGTARLTLAEAVQIPEGSGYLLLQLDPPGGAATTPLAGGEQPVPATGAGLGVAVLALAALALRRQR